MSKEWKMERLGNVFNLQMGKTPDRKNGVYWNDGANKWISIADIKDRKNISETKETISDNAVFESKIKLIPRGTVIMSFKLSIGKVAITGEDMYCNEAIMSFLPLSHFAVDSTFLYYRLLAYDWLSGLNKAVKGVTLNKATLSDTKMSFPISISKQQEIAAVLDKARELVEKRKAQLAELDTLAESIFYDMFGDPVTNEKGWDTDKMKEIAPSKQFQGEVDEYNGLLWSLTLDNIESNTGEITEITLVDRKEIGASTIVFNDHNILYTKLRPYLNKVVLPSQNGYATSELIPLLPNPDRVSRLFLWKLLLSNSFVN